MLCCDQGVGAAKARTVALLGQCAGWMRDLEKQGKITYHFRNIFQSFGFVDVQPVANAAVPIVKMVDAGRGEEEEVRTF